MILALSPELENVGWGLAAIGITLVTLSMVMGIRKKRKKMGGRVTARENLERYKAKAEVRDDLERVMVEVEQMAKRVAAQLDAKTIAVEKLLRDADQRLDQLESAIARLDQAQRDPRASTPTGEAAPGASSSETNGVDKDGQPPWALPQDDLSKQVYALADEGLGPPDIARRLEEHIGKIELILALRSA